MAVIYIVQQGDFDGYRVTYTSIVAFTTRRVAETVVRQAKREDAYAHQYDRVETLHYYRTEKQWLNGIEQRSKAKARRLRQAKG